MARECLSREKRVYMTTQNDPKLVNVLIHDQQFSDHDLVVNSTLFRVIHVDDIIEIAWSAPTVTDAQAQTQEQRALARWKRLVAASNTRQCIYLRAKDVRTVKGAMKISLAKTVATSLQLTARQEVTVRLIDAAEYGQFSLDHVELMFNNQYIGRGEMWRLKLKLRDTCAFVGRRITSCGIRADVTETLRNGEPVLSGLITDATSFVFRSRLGMFYLCLQMSREMWQFDSVGQQYWENGVAFLSDLFERWREAGVTHCVTVLLFSRTYYHEIDAAAFALLEPGVAGTLMRDGATGKYYRDNYRVVAFEEYSTDTVELLRRIKRAVISYATLIDGVDVPAFPLAAATGVAGAGGGSASSRRGALGAGVNSSATDGNVLEAVHLSLVTLRIRSCTHWV
jgi:hypothetical protein